MQIHYIIRYKNPGFSKPYTLWLHRKILLLFCGFVYITGSLEASMVNVERDFVEAFLPTNTNAEYTVNTSFSNSTMVPVYDHINHVEIADALLFKKNTRKKHFPIKDNLVITSTDDVNWSRLKEMIEKDKDVPARNRLLRILNSNLNRENQKAKIKKLNGGKVYEYLSAHIFPYLRQDISGAAYSKNEKTFTNADSIAAYGLDSTFIENESFFVDTIYAEVIKPKKPFVMAIKSNLMYDIALLPNLSVEIPFGRDYQWSVGIEGNWSWWNTKADNYYYHRIQMAGIELRQWFGNKTENALNGWFVGAYGYGGTYDLRLFADKNSDKGQLSNWSYSGGVTFGYAMPIGKRFNLEFGLGVGYLGGKYYKYTVGACSECLFPKQSTHQRSYIGPTKANISLVWLIGDYSNKKKGKEGRQ